MIQRVAWSAMAVLAILVAAYAGAALVVPPLRTPFVGDLFANTPIAIAAHLGGGVVALVVGAFQVNARLRARFLGAHRWMGRLYMAGVIIGGTAGFVLALRSSGGLVAHFGFGMLAVCWLASTLIAYRHIRRGDEPTHRIWMLRSYALTLAAVTLRIYLPASLASGIEFEAAYQVIAWMCWVPNLLAVEWFILARPPQGAVVAT